VINGAGEFREGGREPISRVGVHAEFVVSAAEVLHEGMSGADDAC
jgi:hypothetical protein